MLSNSFKRWFCHEAASNFDLRTKHQLSYFFLTFKDSKTLEFSTDFSVQILKGAYRSVLY